MERMEVVVSGRVQGVMYRDFVERNASVLSLCGFVKNLPDGTVSVCAEGEREKLETLLERLKKGPMFADVREVQVAWSDVRGEHTNFSISYYTPSSKKSS
ncbi:MAG: acylphosphatase [Patescibacteria group bacterium]